MVSMLESKRAISPLIATVLLIVFSVALGAVVMSWGETYIEEKAEFVAGAQEIIGGCDLAQLNVIQIGGLDQVCTHNGLVDVWLDNGPGIDVYDIHARLVGVKEVIAIESILENPLLRNNAVKATFASGVGALRQLKLTPKVLIGDTIIFCAQKAIVIENILPCQ